MNGHAIDRGRFPGVTGPDVNCDSDPGEPFGDLEGMVAHPTVSGRVFAGQEMMD